MKISTIGGNVAENSGGLRGLKYGITRNYVMGLEVVLPNGEIIWTGNKCVKDVAGYSLKDFFIGSEGTLGRHHQGAAQTDPQAGRQENDGGDLRANGPRGRGGFGHHRRADHSLHAGIFGPHHHSLRGGLRQDRPAPGLRGAAADGNRRPSRRGGRRSRAHGTNLPRERLPGSPRRPRRGRRREAGRRPPQRLLRAGARRAHHHTGGRHRAAQRTGAA